jgi:hypothetical protein
LTAFKAHLHNPVIQVHNCYSHNSEARAQQTCLQFDQSTRLILLWHGSAESSSGDIQTYTLVHCGERVKLDQPDLKPSVRLSKHLFPKHDILISALMHEQLCQL